MTWGASPWGALPWGSAPVASWPVAGPMENLLLLSPQYSDSGTIAATSEVASLPASNMLTVQPTRKWQSATTTVSLIVTLAQPVPCNALALVGHNLTAAAIWRLRGALTVGTLSSAPVVDTGLCSPWPLGIMPTMANWPNQLSLLRWSNIVALPCWQLDIVDPHPAQTYLEAGRLVLGPSWQPSLNFDVAGSPLALDQMDVQTKTSWGYTFTEPRAASAGRTFNLQVSAVDRREVLDGLFEIQRLRGQWGDVICCLDPAETTDFHRFSMQGYFVPKADYPIVPQYTANGAMFTAKIQLAEFL